MSEDQKEAPEAGADDGLLTLDEAVKFLDTSKSTLYRLLNLQDIKGVKVGKQWRFRRSDLIAYVERSPVAVAVDAFARADLDAELEFFNQEYSSVGGPPLSDMADSAGKSPETKIIDLANWIVLLAIALNASDIHLDPNATSLRVRYRIDGVLQDIRRIPASLRESIITRLKEMSDMNLMEKRLPQDGRMMLSVDDREYDVRMSLMPTLFGENAVMRILYRSGAVLGLERLGMSSHDLEALRGSIHGQSGLILMTGPTGAGKTTLLYSCLAEIGTPDKKVLTIEDPIEYSMPDITQVQHNPRAGVTFAVGMRSALRQDPDVIMCGEIRDLDTAEVVVRGALTGHLVMSALHTDDAPSALSRIVGIGVEPYVVSAALKCVVATRLARRLCPQCKTIDDFVGREKQMLRARQLAERGGCAIPKEATFYTPVGCDECHNTGFRGRLGLYSVLVCNPKKVAELIRCDSDDEATMLAVQSGMKTLFADGMQKAAHGETSVDEVIRATGAAL